MNICYGRNKDIDINIQSKAFHTSKQVNLKIGQFKSSYVTTIYLYKKNLSFKCNKITASLLDVLL